MIRLEGVAVTRHILQGAGRHDRLVEGFARKKKDKKMREERADYKKEAEMKGMSLNS